MFSFDRRPQPAANSVAQSARADIKGVRFSPDGLLLLSTDDSRKLTVYGLPDSTFEAATGADDEMAGAIPPLPVRCSSVQAEGIRGYAWYPNMRVMEDATTAAFACVSGHQPVHLCDALTGCHRASYRPHTRMDELAQCYSVGFTSDGAQLLAGSDSAVYTFDLSRPGRESRVLSSAGRRRSAHGQHGLLAALATTPTQPHVVAAGSYHGSIWLYDLRAGGSSAGTGSIGAVVDDGSGVVVTSVSQQAQADAAGIHSAADATEAAVGGSGSGSGSVGGSGGAGAGAAAEASSSAASSASAPLAVTSLTGHKRKRQGASAHGSGSTPGVTQLQFSADGGMGSGSSPYLFAGYRKAGAILQWDLRQTKKPVARYGRDASSNQRIGFDLAYGVTSSGSGGLQLLTGCRSGAVRVYDTARHTATTVFDGFPDAVNDVSCNPVGVVFAVATGQRHPEERSAGAAVDSGDEADGDEDEEDRTGSSGSSSSSTSRRTGGVTQAGASSQRALDMRHTVSLWRTPVPSSAYSSGWSAANASPAAASEAAGPSATAATAATATHADITTAEAAASDA